MEEMRCMEVSLIFLAKKYAACKILSTKKWMLHEIGRMLRLRPAPQGRKILSAGLVCAAVCAFQCAGARMRRV